MMFNSPDECKRYFENKFTDAAVESEHYLYENMRRGTDHFYSEFTPVEYERTNSFRNSLQRTGVSGAVDDYDFEVYFNPDYSYISGRASGADVVESATQGIHGVAGMNVGYIGNPFLSEIESYIEGDIVGIVKKHLS